MAISRDKKVEIINKVKETLEQYPTVVFVNFHGLSVEDDHHMRAQFTDKNVGYFVAKKTLVKRAINQSDVAGELPSLDGELALAYSTDQVAPAREVHQYGKNNGDAVSILGGIFEGSLRDKQEMEEIASIPPVETLYGQLANVINSPIQGLAVALGQVAEQKES
jgi:large subunit ribosomal protein L10